MFTTQTQNHSYNLRGGESQCFQHWISFCWWRVPIAVLVFLTAAQTGKTPWWHLSALGIWEILSRSPVFVVSSQLTCDRAGVTEGYRQEGLWGSSRHSGCEWQHWGWVWLWSPISQFHSPALSFPGQGSKVLKRSVSQRWPCLPHSAVVGTEWNTGVSRCLVEGPHHTRELSSLLCARNFIHTTFCMPRRPRLWNEGKG